MREQYNFPVAQIGNMDETPVWFDMPNARTVNAKGEKTVMVRTTGHEKSRFTVVLACMGDGFRLKPFIIFKRKTMPKGNFPPGIIVHVHPNGWMNEDGVKLWNEKVWDVDLVEFQRKRVCWYGIRSVPILVTM